MRAFSDVVAIADFLTLGTDVPCVTAAVRAAVDDLIPVVTVILVAFVGTNIVEVFSGRDVDPAAAAGPAISSSSSLDAMLSSNVFFTLTADN